LLENSLFPENGLLDRSISQYCDLLRCRYSDYHKQVSIFWQARKRMRFDRYDLINHGGLRIRDVGGHSTDVKADCDDVGIDPGALAIWIQFLDIRNMRDSS
jgi:hypothetical protein